MSCIVGSGTQVPPGAEGRQIGLTLMDEKWLGTTFLLLLSFSILHSAQVVLCDCSNTSIFSIFSFVSFLRITKELPSMTA